MVERMLAPSTQKRYSLTQADLDEILGVVGVESFEGSSLVGILEASR
jgi:hypothetical protein